MPDAYLLLTPLALAAIVLLLAFAGCGPAPLLPPFDVLVFADFTERDTPATVLEVKVLWQRVDVDVGSLQSVVVTSSRAAFDGGSPTPRVVAPIALDVRHRWDPNTCRITFVNVPVRGGETWDVECRLTAVPTGAAAPRVFRSERRTIAFASEADPVTRRFVLTLSGGSFTFR
jgi:hypothetical protein